MISGPSGVGKDAVISQMSHQFKNFHFTVTATTRQKRENEINLKDYIFLSKDQFENMLATDEFLEHAEVYGNYYGVPKSQILAPTSNGNNVLLRVDVQGAMKIKNTIPEVILIFIKPDSINSVKKHLSDRGQLSSEQIKTRLDSMNNEIELSKHFDYIIINEEGNIDSVVNKVKDIINQNI